LGSNINKIVYDWKNVKNIAVKFIYDDIKGEIEINSYNKEDRKLSLNYLDRLDFKMATGHFMDCKLKELLGLKTIKYKYDIGDTIENNTSKIKILKQIRISCNSKSKPNRTDKGYTYECLNCGNIDDILESHLIEDKGCNVCCPTPQKVLRGYNDIATTHPHLIKYFINIEDAYTHTYGSEDYVDVICDRCGYIKNVKINKFTAHGIQCPKCGDGFSYPNKFVFNVLEQLGINFKPEKTFDWSLEKRYDFYLIDFNYIIEAHGMQHYEDTKIGQGNGRSFIEEKWNDKFKKVIAKGNGIKNKDYIVN